MVWIPGHCAIVGNELADAAAARGCSMVSRIIGSTLMGRLVVCVMVERV